MIFRLPAKAVDLRHLALDGIDMFLITRIESGISLGQLLDVSPCGAVETTRRLRQLARLRVVECEGEFPDEEPLTKPRGRSLGQLVRAAPAFEDATTLRPPRRIEPRQAPEPVRVDHVFVRSARQPAAGTVRLPSRTPRRPTAR